MTELNSALNFDHRQWSREQKNDLCKSWEISGLSRSEFCRIIKTKFILTYIDELPLRQHIEKQLNKVELSNKFAKAVLAVGYESCDRVPL